MHATISPDKTGRELHITRLFEAPREVVWRAWSDLHLARQWWGPKGFTVSELPLAMRPGGVWRAVMHSPDEEKYPAHGILEEIVPTERLGFTLLWDDEGPTSDMRVTVTLTPQAEQTRMTFRKGPFPSEEWRREEEDGWNEAFDRLRAIVERGEDRPRR